VPAGPLRRARLRWARGTNLYGPQVTIERGWRPPAGEICPGAALETAHRRPGGRNGGVGAHARACRRRGPFSVERVAPVCPPGPRWRPQNAATPFTATVEAPPPSLCLQRRRLVSPNVRPTKWRQGVCRGWRRLGRRGRPHRWRASGTGAPGAVGLLLGLLAALPPARPLVGSPAPGALSPLRVPPPPPLARPARALPS